MDSINEPLKDGFYIFSFEKVFRGPFRPIYAKGFIDGLRLGAHSFGTEFYLVQVRDGKIRKMKGQQ